LVLFFKKELLPVRLIAVGKLKAGPEADLFERYTTRIKPKLSLMEIPEGHGAPAEVKRREAEALLAALPGQCFAIALDHAAPPPSSEIFAQHLETWLAEGKDVVFLIGGAEGFDRTVLDRANHVLSLGPLTWPHMLVRVMLAEQIYRARSIAAGHPYHRAGRPS
jgi:23S rRNA (pseudouridine1915-N3)-methyltransferase